MAGWFGCGCTCKKDDTTENVEITADKSVSYSRPDEEAIATPKVVLEEKTPKESADRSPESGEFVEAKDLPSPDAPTHGNPSSTSMMTGTGTASGSTASATTSCVTPSSMRVGDGELTPMSDLPEDVRQVLEEAERTRLSGYAFTAEKSLVELLARLKEEGKDDIIEKVKLTKTYLELIVLMEEVNRNLVALLDDEGWELQKEAEKVLVWTRPEPGTDLVTVRIAGLVEGPFDNFCSIGREVHLIKTWMPGVKRSHIIKLFNDTDFISYYVWKFPFIAGREFLVDERNVIADKEGYCVTMRQPPVERPGVELPKLEKGTVRADISNWCSFSAPCGEKKTFCVTVMNVDLKMPLPMRLVNYLSVSMGYQSFKDLRQNVQKSLGPKSEFKECIANPANKGYYDRMRSLEKARDTKPIACQQEIFQTGWVKDPEDRKKIFNRSSSKDVLVPML